MFSQTNLRRLLFLLLFTLGKLCLFIEGIHNLAKQLFVDDAPFATIFDELLRIFEERVKLLILGLIDRLSGVLREVPEHVKLQKASK